MKRTPLKRKTPLKAKRRPAKRSRKPRLGYDPERLAWVRKQACAMCGDYEYGTPVDAHHPTGAGLALKAPDSDAFPLCSSSVRFGAGCHQHLHALTGPFKGWTKDQLRRWQDAQSEVYKVLWEVHCAD